MPENLATRLQLLFDEIGLNASEQFQGDSLLPKEWNTEGKHVDCEALYAYVALFPSVVNIYNVFHLSVFKRKMTYSKAEIEQMKAIANQILEWSDSCWGVLNFRVFGPKPGIIQHCDTMLSLTREITGVPLQSDAFLTSQ